MAELIGNEYLMGEIMEIMELEIDIQKGGHSTLVPVIVGDPGTGKSASLKALAKRLNYDIYIISLGAKPMEEFSGLPEFSSMEVPAEYSTEGKTEVKITEWTMSGIIAAINHKTEVALQSGKNGLLVLLDDLHLTEPIIQKYMFEFLQNKTLQNYRVHGEALLIGAMNGKDSAGMEGFLSAVIDRMAIYHSKFDKDFWYNAIGHSLHPYVASFSKGPNDKYFVGANSIDSSSPSPRSWTELSEALIKIEKKYSSDIGELNRKIKIMAEARVGSEATVEFMKHVKLFQKFDFETIFAKKDPEFKIPEDISDQILLSFIIRYTQSEEDVDYLIDILNRNKNRRTFISVLINEYEVILRNLREMPEGKSKKAFQYLSDCIVDEEKVDEELLDTIVDGVIDIQ